MMLKSSTQFYDYYEFLWEDPGNTLSVFQPDYYIYRFKKTKNEVIDIKWEIDVLRDD